MSRDKGDDYGYWGDMRNEPPPKACAYCKLAPQECGLHCRNCCEYLHLEAADHDAPKSL